MGMRPVPNNFPITQSFKQNFTQYNYGAAHGALDFGVPIGTPVVATEAGNVIFDGWAWGLPASSWEARFYLIRPEQGDTRTGGGILTIIDHGNYISIYAHMNETYLFEGNRVRKGQVIGVSGNTGSSTGPHLHFAIITKPYNWFNGFYGGVDPVPYITEPYAPTTNVDDNKTTEERAFNGIDVSAYQPANIVDLVSSQFVIVKTTEGVGWQSDKWKQQLSSARRKGLKVGVYHYARPGSNSSDAEADYFYNTTKSMDSPDLIWFLDWEEAQYYNYTNWARDFMYRLDKLTGRTTGLYANTQGLITGVWSETDRKRPLWRAFPVLSGTGYATSFNLPSPPGGWSRLVMDQYSFHGRLSGYSGDLDLNVYYGGIPQWGAAGSAVTTKEWDEMASKEEIQLVVAGQTQPLTNAITALTKMIESTGPFKDVAPNHVFAREITWAKENKLLRGYADGTFQPSSLTYRDQVAAVLYRLSGSPEFTSPGTPVFSDVPKTHVFYKEISWLHANGISGGWTAKDGTKLFKPSDPVYRDQMAAFLYRVAGSPQFTAPAVSPYADVSVSRTFYAQIAWLESTGISVASDDKKFLPESPVTRDVLASFLYNYSRQIIRNRRDI